MDPHLRHRILRGIGFELLDFEYTQPPLQEDKHACNELVLCMHRRYVTNEGAPSKPIAEWIAEFFCVLMGKKKGRRDVEYLRQRDLLSKMSHVPLLKASHSTKVNAEKNS